MPADPTADPSADSSADSIANSNAKEGGRRTLRKRPRTQMPALPPPAPLATTPPARDLPVDEAKPDIDHELAWAGLGTDVGFEIGSEDAGEPAAPSPPVYPSGRTAEQFWASIAVPSVWALLVSLLLGAGVGLGAANYERTRAPVYQSTAVVLFDNPAVISSSPGSVIAIANDRGKYAGLVQTDAFAVPAAERIGVTPGQIEGQVRALIDPASLNLDIVAQASAPDVAQRLSLGAAEYLVDYVTNEQAALATPSTTDLRLQVRMISNPRPGVRVSPTHQKEITSGIVYGLVAFAAVYVIGQLIADRVRVRRRARSTPSARRMIG